MSNLLLSLLFVAAAGLSASPSPTIAVSDGRVIVSGVTRGAAVRLYWVVQEPVGGARSRRFANAQLADDERTGQVSMPITLPDSGRYAIVAIDGLTGAHACLGCAEPVPGPKRRALGKLRRETSMDVIAGVQEDIQVMIVRPNAAVWDAFGFGQVAADGGSDGWIRIPSENARDAQGNRAPRRLNPSDKVLILDLNTLFLAVEEAR